MAHTRSRLASSQPEYFAALALHHARVAQVSVDMHKLAKMINCTLEPTPPTPETMQHLAQMAEVIELSFAKAFGYRLRPPKNGGVK